MARRGRRGVGLRWSGEFSFLSHSLFYLLWCAISDRDTKCGRFALYEDVVTNDTLAEQYRQYMLQHLGLRPEQMVPLKEARTVHDSAGSS